MEYDKNGKDGHLGCPSSYNFNVYIPNFNVKLNSQGREQTNALIERCAVSLRQKYFMRHMKCFLPLEILCLPLKSNWNNFWKFLSTVKSGYNNFWKFLFTHPVLNTIINFEELIQSNHRLITLSYICHQLCVEHIHLFSHLTWATVWVITAWFICRIFDPKQPKCVI